MQIQRASLKVCNFHDWVEQEFGPEGITRDHWIDFEIYQKAKEAGLVHDESNIDQVYAAIGHTRTLKAGFIAKLEILYERSCTSNPKNILCIPYIPTNWLIPFVNLSNVVLTKNLYHNPACQPTWKSTGCLLCWDGVYNAIQEIRFSIYFLDLLSIIFIFGIFTPRPSELIGYLGEEFPPLKPLVNLILIYPVGTFPDGQQWGCYFINYL